jgi:YD repeat-containing protein
VLHRIVEDKVAEYGDTSIEWDGEGNVVEHSEPWRNVTQLPLGVRLR